MLKFTHIGAFYQLIRAVSRINQDPGCPERLKIFEPVTFRGTTKIHGCNAGVAFSATGEGNPQSRNTVLSLQKDHVGFARFCSGAEQTQALRTVAARIRAAHEIPEAGLTLFGEWCGPGIPKGCGPGIPKGCGVHLLPEKQFVLFAAAAGTGDAARYLDAITPFEGEFASASFYSIMDGPSWELVVDFSDRASVVAAAAKITEITQEVEKMCPWAALFGAEGIGEGIVWAPVGAHWGRTDLYFKSKGAKHKAASPKQKTVKVDPEKLEDIEAFIAFAVTENRLSQAVEFLREHGRVLEMRAMGPFLKWMAEDIRRECAAEMAENSLDWKEVGKPVQATARNWFVEFIHTL